MAAPLGVDRADYTSGVKLQTLLTMAHCVSSSRSRQAFLLQVAGILTGFVWFLNSLAQDDVSKEEKLAREIVEKADQIRFPADGFQVDVAIANSNAGQVTDNRQYRVLSKGNENTIVMVTEPASDRGQIMLMKGRDLWMFLPNVSQPGG
jgi:hypothetical protein